MFGGGTGWIIPYLQLDQIQKLTFVESSHMMLKVAKGESSKYSKGVIDFIHGDEASFPDEKFDCIISNFVLDCFSESRLKDIMAILKSHLKAGGLWYCSEFKQNPTTYRTFWQYILLGLMRLFFKITSGLESNSLLDFDRYFVQSDLKEIYTKKYLRDFIVTKVWR